MPAKVQRMTAGMALRQGTLLLEQGSVPAPRLTAEVLLCHAMRREDRSYLYAHPEEELTQIAWIHYGRYLHDRLKGKPTQYITKRQEFYGREFRVTPDVLIPRPETEHLVEAVLGWNPPPARIVDVGCGSGAIAVTLSLELPDSVVYAADLSMAALKVAAGNALRLRAQVKFLNSDLLRAFAPASLDAVISNPPYVPEEELEHLQREVRDYEPRVALSGGLAGNEIYQRLIQEAEVILVPGGWLGLELGYRSAEAVSGMIGTRWTAPSLIADLAGIPRVLTARRKP